jgi:hypothetical protein
MRRPIAHSASCHETPAARSDALLSLWPIIVAKCHIPAALRNGAGEVERDASAALEHVRVGGLGERLPEQQGDRLPRGLRARQDGCQVVRVSGG